MLELLLCSAVTVLPDYLFRRYVQGKRLGHEITLFSVWYELRWGITLCLILTVALITTIFYFHPSSTSAVSFYRTISILPEGYGRVTEVYVNYRDEVHAGDPLFRMDSTQQQAAVDTAKYKVAEIDAEMEVAKSHLAEADGKIAQAKGMLQQATDEYNTRAELLKRSQSAVSQRDVEKAQVAVDTQQGMVDAAVAAKAAMQTEIDYQLPAEKKSAEAALREAEVALSKTTVYAGVDGWVEQFTLRPGDVVNQMMRPAGILVPSNAGRIGLEAGFDQIEAQVIKPGMVGEVACAALPFSVVPVVVTQVQSVIASGQVRPTDALLDPQSTAPGTLLAYLEPLYPGALDKLPPGSSCIANAYTSNYEALHSGQVGGVHAFLLHAIDTVGLVHAALLRIQALLMPVKTLVLSGGH
ncbi:MAG: HlyD family secretion protein [Rhodobacteraceae bacterium]|nr:HlyD family secretion protein [Paracoccaceae bacterium]